MRLVHKKVRLPENTFAFSGLKAYGYNSKWRFAYLTPPPLSSPARGEELKKSRERRVSYPLEMRMNYNLSHIVEKTMQLAACTIFILLGWTLCGGNVLAGITERVSISNTQTNGNNSSYRPSVSSDGRYVAFESLAGNLVTGDTNGYSDIFVHDRQTGVTQRVSLTSGGAQGNNHSYRPSVSSDGRYVTFYTMASNFVSGDTNGASDVFVYHRQQSSGWISGEQYKYIPLHKY